MMDTSGSMGTFEKYIARSFYFWMVRFLRTRYRNVRHRLHRPPHRGREVDEEEFFSKGESGGTQMLVRVQAGAARSSTSDTRPREYNIYPFHFSDGDNYPSDNARCLKLAQRAGAAGERVRLRRNRRRGVYRDDTRSCGCWSASPNPTWCG